MSVVNPTVTHKCWMLYYWSVLVYVYLLRKGHLRAVGWRPIEAVVFLTGRRIAADLGRVLLAADQSDVARTQLIERVLEAAVRHEATLTKRQFALTDGLAMSTGAAQSGLAIRIAMATGSLNVPNKGKLVRQYNGIKTKVSIYLPSDSK